MGASDKAGLTHPSNVDSALRTKGLTIVLAAIVLTTSLYANIAHMLGLQWFFRFVPPFTGRDSWMMDHLGGEHRWIATALAAGKGFSDPFREPTGPSAWVAPVLPFIQAVPMAIGGIRLATIAVAMLQNMSLIFTGWVVLRAARRSDWRGASSHCGRLVYWGNLVSLFFMLSVNTRSMARHVLDRRARSHGRPSLCEVTWVSSQYRLGPSRGHGRDLGARAGASLGSADTFHRSLVAYEDNIPGVWIGGDCCRSAVDNSKCTRFWTLRSDQIEHVLRALSV